MCKNEFVQEDFTRCDTETCSALQSCEMLASPSNEIRSRFQAPLCLCWMNKATSGSVLQPDLKNAVNGFDLLF